MLFRSVAWLDFRIDYIAWAIQKLSGFCIVLFMVQSVDRIILCLGCFWIKIRGLKPRLPAASKKNADDLEDGDPDDLDAYFPMVLVQMPMCNEKEVSVLPCSLRSVSDSSPWAIRSELDMHGFRWMDRCTRRRSRTCARSTGHGIGC